MRYTNDYLIVFTKRFCQCLSQIVAFNINKRPKQLLQQLTQTAMKQKLVRIPLGLFHTSGHENDDYFRTIPVLQQASK